MGNSVANIKFLANGGLLVAPSDYWTISVWNVTTGQAKFTLTSSFLSAEELSNSNLLISSQDRYLRIYNVTTGRLVYQVYAYDQQFSLKQTSIPNLVASAGMDYNVHVWDINTLNQVYKLTGHTGGVCYLDSTSSGFLLSGANDNLVKLWNVTVTTALSSTPQLSGTIMCVKMVASNQLAVGLYPKSIQFINISSSNVLIMGSQVSLITDTNVFDMHLTMENILAISQRDGSVFFLNLNTSTFVQSLTPVVSAFAYDLDLIGSCFFFIVFYH
jgi:WD40 repeat protein